MNVILKQDVEKLGKIGDVVKVAPGYGRNYLIPKKLARRRLPATSKSSKRKGSPTHGATSAKKQAATILAREIVKLTVTIRRKTGEEADPRTAPLQPWISRISLTSHKIDYRQAEDPAGRPDQDDRRIPGADSSAPRRDDPH